MEASDPPEDGSPHQRGLMLGLQGRGWTVCLVRGSRPREPWAAAPAAFGGSH